MYCFADFEFTCGVEIPKSEVEILSVGLIIVDDECNIKEEYYKTIKPLNHPKLTTFCKELTHLTQSEIDVSEDSNVVFGEVVKLLNKYSVSNVYVWGDFDKIAISMDSKVHKKSAKPFENINIVSKKIKNIQEEIALKLGLNSIISIKIAKEVLQIKNTGVLHNALTDAEIFLETYRIAYFEDISQYKELAKLSNQRKEKEKNRIKQMNRSNKNSKKLFTKSEKIRIERLNDINKDIAELYSDIIKMLPTNDAINAKHHTKFAIIAPFNDIECIQIIDKKKNEKNKFGINTEKLKKNKYCILHFQRDDYPIAKYNFALKYASKLYNIDLEDKMVKDDYMDTDKANKYFYKLKEVYDGQFKDDYYMIREKTKKIFKQSEIKGYTGVQIIYTKKKKILVNPYMQERDVEKTISKKSMLLPIEGNTLNDIIISFMEFVLERKVYNKAA